MKTQTFVLTLITVCGATVVAVLKGMPSDGEGLRGEEQAQLESRLGALEERLLEFDRTLNRLAESGGPAPTPEIRLSRQDVLDAVSKLMEGELGEQLGLAKAGDDAVPDGEQADAEQEINVGTFLAELRAGNLSRAEIEAGWAAIVAAGMLDEAIEGMEALVELDPSNPDLRARLGDAYIQMLLSMPEGPTRGMWALKADGAFDDALELDPNHWDARFNKSISLAFWPPIFGKQASAVKNFEVLVAQQEAGGGSGKPEYAQTYQFLGNLYMQQGKLEQARKIWSRGLTYFPDNSGLIESLGQ